MIKYYFYLEIAASIYNVKKTINVKKLLHLSPVPSTTIDCMRIGRNAKRDQLKPRAMLFIALFKRSAIFLVQSDPDYAE